MISSMSLKKVMTVATAIGIATCLSPMPAQAQEAVDDLFLVLFNGNSDDNTDVTFLLNQAFLNPNASGQPGTVVNGGVVQEFIIDENSDSPPPPVRRSVENLSISTITNGTLRLSDGVSFDVSSDIPGGTNNLRYDIRLNNSSNDFLTLFVPSQGNNDFQAFTNFLASTEETEFEPGIPGVLIRNQDSGEIDDFFGLTDTDGDGGSIPFEVRKVRRTAVPEPTTTFGLLGLGALSAISFLKRNQRL